MADEYGYGSFSGVPYPYWLSSSSPYPPASAPPFLASHPAEPSYDPTEGRFDPMISHGSYHRSPSYRANSRSQTPSSSFYADNSRPEVCCPGGDSYKANISPRGFYSPMEPSSYYAPLPTDNFSERQRSPGYYPMEPSSDFVPLHTDNFSERQRLNFVRTCNSATSAPVSSLAEMIIRNSQEPFFKPKASSGVYASSNTLDEKYPGHYLPGYDKPENMNLVSGPPVEPHMYVTDSIPSLPMSSLKTQALFDGSRAGIHLGEGRSFPSNNDVCDYAPENSLGVQSSLHGSSIEPVNFDVLLGYGEATGHIKPLSENSDLRYRIVGSQGSRSVRSSHPLPINIKSPSSLFKDELEGMGDSSLYQRPNTLVADSENGISESSMKNAVENLNSDEHRSWNHFMVSSEGPSAPTMFSLGSESCGAMKADNGNAQSAVNYKTPFESSANQPSEDVQANQKPCKLQEQMFDIMNKDKKTTLLTNLGLKGSSRSNADDVSIGQSPERHLCDQGDFPSPTSSPRVSSVVNAMHNLSEVLVYECFNNGSWLKLEQLENLDKVVDNLTKCLKKITSNKTIARETSLPTQAIHVSCPNVVNLDEGPKGVAAKDLQGFNVKPVDSFGFKEQVDKNEMTQSIKNILASNFPDVEENYPQTLLYKNLWLETEAALCSTTCMARYHRVKNEIGNLKLHNRENSADASTLMQEPSRNSQKSVPIMNNAEQETTESLSNCGNNVVTKSHDAPQSSRFNSDPVDAAVLSLMCRSFTGGLEEKPGAANSRRIQQQESPAEDKHNDDVIDRFQILKHQETKRKLKSQNCPDDVIDRFQILKQQETNRKLKSQSCPETKMGDEEENPEASEMANIGRSSHVSDVMDRFQILKRREAEQMQKSLNSFNIDKTQMHGDLHDTEPSASGKGYESPSSDWEHVLNDD